MEYLFLKEMSKLIFEKILKIISCILFDFLKDEFERCYFYALIFCIIFTIKQLYTQEMYISFKMI